MLNFKKFQIFLTFISIIISFTILNYSCKDTAVSPPEDTPGRRDYVWTVDTLNCPADPMFRMWGSSPTDIWTTSYGNWDKSISHFDGEEWSSFGVQGIAGPWAIYGFSDYEVYIGSSNGNIWRFDGTTWTQFAQLNVEGTDYITFENIWGESSNNFYAVGNGPDANNYANFSFIGHFFKNKWEILNTDDLIGNVVHLYRNHSDKKIYFRLTKIGGSEFIDSTIIYEYTSEKNIKLYSSIETKGLQADISLINNEVYFILGSQIAIRVNDKFQTILNVENPNFYQRIWGRNSKDIFLLMTDGLAHYNGSNVKYLFHFNLAEVKPWTQIYGAALIYNEAFFLAYEPTTHLNLIYHGIIK